MSRPYVSPCFMPGGRLGNVMFTLATAYAHAMRVGVECRVPWFFNDSSHMLRDWLGNTALPSTPCGANEPTAWHEPRFSYTPIPEDIREGGLGGYFQSARYFEGQEAAIRQLFSRFIAKKQPGVAGVHIRLGDYKDLTYRYHSAADTEFLRKALPMLSDDIKHIIIFSDEPEEAAERFESVPGAERFTIEIDHSSPCEAIQRMTAMQELIISCSTFSWWGAWLGHAEHVYLPDKWFIDNMEDEKDICPAHWHKL